MLFFLILERVNNRRQFSHSKAEILFQPVLTPTKKTQKKKNQKTLGFLPKLQSWNFLGCPLPFSCAFLMPFTDDNNASLWAGNTPPCKIIGLSFLSKFNAFCSLFFVRAIHYIRECDFSLSKLFPSRGKPHAANGSIVSILAIQLSCLIWRAFFFLKEVWLSTFPVSVLTFK